MSQVAAPDRSWELPRGARRLTDVSPVGHTGRVTMGGLVAAKSNNHEDSDVCCTPPGAGPRTANRDPQQPGARLSRPAPAAALHPTSPS